MTFLGLSVADWTGIIGLIFAFLTLAIGSYIAIVKVTTKLKMDINNGFNKLRDIEKDVYEDIKEIKSRLDNKGIKLQELESALYVYLKRHEAEEVYCKKEVMEPKIALITANQNEIHNDIKEFRIDFKDTIKDIVASLNKHIENDMQFQRELLKTFKENK